MNITDRILVTGHKGLVGSALVRRLRANGFQNIVTWDRSYVDLTNSAATCWAFSTHCIDYVFHCAARVGGIQDNKNNPVSFLMDNLKIQENVIINSAAYSIKKLVFLGSSCVYPNNAAQPIKESSLLTGPFTPDVEAYGLAKVAGIRLCQYLRKERGCNFVAAMPCNIFGPNDNFDPETAHVVPGMMARMHHARVKKEKEFRVWGHEQVMREHIFSDDLAEALILIMLKYNDPEPINTGSGFETTMADLAHLMAHTVGYNGIVSFDSTRPVGIPRKVLDNSKLTSLGFEQKIPFFKALGLTYREYLTCLPTTHQ